MTTTYDNPRIYEYMTKATWLHAEAATNIGKIRLFAGSYQRGQGAKQNTACFLDIADARVLFSDLSWGKRVKFVDYKGSTSGNVISRVLRINTDKTGDKIYFELSSGPGRASDTGAVMPAGDPTVKINVGMTINDARKLAYAVLEYLLAHAVLQQMDSAEDEETRRTEPAETAVSPPPSPNPLSDLTDNEFNDLLFGDESNVPTPKPTPQPNGNHNGRSTTTTAAPTLPPPITTNNTRLYTTGDPVKPEHHTHFDTFIELMRTAPYNEEKLISWVYRN